MKLREKTLLLIGIIVVCSIVIMYIASNVILLNGFETLEKQNTIGNIKLTTNVLSNELLDLDKVVADWANWDDSYNFMQNNNSAYIESNLVNSTFTSLKLNLILYVDNSGNIVYGNGFDLQNGKQEPIPEGISEYISKNSTLLNQSSEEGIIQLPGGPMMVVSHPILTSDGKGPSRGTLIFGRYLNQAEIQHISNLTQLSVTVYNFNDSNMPSDFQNARHSISKDSSIFVNPLNNSYIAGYTTINDINGKPALILRIDRPRGLYNEYQNSIFYSLLSLLMVGSAFALVALIYLDKVILFRLSRFSHDIFNIGKDNNLSARMPVDGDDEISSLAGSINGMLSQIEISQNKFKESELKFRSVIQLAGDGIILTDSNGKIILWNRGSQMIFGYTEKEILGKSISLLFPDKYWISHQKTLENPHNFTDSGTMGKTYELYGFKKDMSKFMLEISDTSWKINNEKLYCAIIRDITDRKSAEDEIKKSLKEKEALLKEIHHRVKNNMQVISSLLSLQCMYTNDKEAVNILNESRSRVKSMALIHENLYQSEDLAEIDFSEYIQNLISELFRSYDTDSNYIKFNINADRIFLNTETAIPCGLIINELVTNSLKYAFPEIYTHKSANDTSESLDKKIYIKLHRDDGKISLTIGDNGVGIPEGIDFENIETLGLRIVKTLVDQIDGTIEFHNKGSAEFRIIFTQIEPENRI